MHKVNVIPSDGNAQSQRHSGLDPESIFYIVEMGNQIWCKTK